MNLLRIALLLFLNAIALCVAVFVCRTDNIATYALSRSGLQAVRAKDVVVGFSQSTIGRLEFEISEAQPPLRFELDSLSVGYSFDSLKDRALRDVSIRGVKIEALRSMFPESPSNSTASALPQISVLPVTALTVESLQFNSSADSINIESVSGVQIVPSSDLKHITVQSAGLNMRYGDLVLSDLSGQVEYTIQESPSVIFELKAAQVDVGVTATDLFAQGKIDSDLTITITSSKARFSEARVSADNFTLKERGRVGRVPLVVRGVDLARIAALYGRDDLKVSGVVDGTLPITLGAKGIRMTEGRLQARSPGGVIEYTGNSGLDATDPRAALVAKILRHIDYSALQARVNYSTNGDIVLALNIRGRSPSVSSEQEINLNVNVEENIPAFLKTLRLARGEGLIKSQ